MNRADLFDLMDALTREIGLQNVLDELAQGLSTDELEYQLTAIAKYYDVEDLVNAEV